MESAEQKCFWSGYERALRDSLPQTRNEVEWSGWEFGFLEKNRIFEKKKKTKKRFWIN